VVVGRCCDISVVLAVDGCALPEPVEVTVRVIRLVAWLVEKRAAWRLDANWVKERKRAWGFLAMAR
jgi:hypothetical protein